METLSSTRKQSWLTWFLKSLLVMGFIILIGRLVDLMVIRGSYFRTLAEGNRVRKIPILAPRGMILARGGEILVGNKILEKQNAELISEFERDYLMKGSFAHVGGYIGAVSEEELGKVKGKCPEKGPRRIGSLIGRGGLEEEYDCILTGYDGEELIEVDVNGLRVRTLGRRAPKAGNDLKTTIDKDLQEKIAGLMTGKKGAVVVSDAKGEMLSLFSSPSYDPNVFGKKDKTAEITKLLSDKDHSLLNRATGGIFHPGSIFKPVVAIAALEEGKIDKDFVFTDEGQIVIQTSYGNFTYSNWYFTQYGGKEGKIGLERAIARSTDTFFYKVGEMLGADSISNWAVNFGLSQKTGIDIPGEIPGLIPNPKWKLRVKGERWFLGNTYHLSIGQGDLALTPLGINFAISAIASGGELCTPHIVSKELALEKCKDLGVKKENIDFVKRGMVDACQPGGTGASFFDFREKSGIVVACKTGTAENENGDPHAWFTVFAPADEPEIVATILVENGGEGSRVASPIAREIFDYWFGREKNE